MKDIVELMTSTQTEQGMKKKNTIRFTSLLLILLVGLWSATGCSEVIDLDTDNEGGQLVIFGRISNGTQGNTVTVSRTGLDGEAPIPVTGAQITISNARGESELLVPDAREPGTYELPGNVMLREPGEQFSLQVIVGNQVYRTALQEMPELVGEDYLSFETGVNVIDTQNGVDVEEGVVKVFARTEFDNLPDEFYLRWNIEETYTYLGTNLPQNNFPFTGGAIQCYVTNDLNTQTLFLHNGEENRATTISERLFVNRRIDKSFQALHYFNLIRSSISREAYTYWSRIEDVTVRQGSIFDRPPAPVPGNIISESSSEDVLGFFEVISVDTTRLALTNNDVPRFFIDNCELERSDFLRLFRVPRDCRQCVVDEGIAAAECIFCNALPGSSNVRPSYF